MPRQRTPPAGCQQRVRGSLSPTRAFSSAHLVRRSICTVCRLLQPPFAVASVQLSSCDSTLLHQFAAYKHCPHQQQVLQRTDLAPMLCEVQQLESFEFVHCPRVALLTNATGMLQLCFVFVPS